jgi:hypothetical protein
MASGLHFVVVHVGTMPKQGGIAGTMGFFSSVQLGLQIAPGATGEASRSNYVEGDLDDM